MGRVEGILSYSLTYVIWTLYRLCLYISRCMYICICMNYLFHLVQKKEKMILTNVGWKLWDLWWAELGQLPDAHPAALIPSPQQGRGRK